MVVGIQIASALAKPYGLEAALYLLWACHPSEPKPLAGFWARQRGGDGQDWSVLRYEGCGFHFRPGAVRGISVAADPKTLASVATHIIRNM
jgi:hypothetical protein